MPRQPRGYREPRRGVHGIEEPQRQLGIVALLLVAMGQFLDVEVGQHADEGRPHIDPVAKPQMRQIIETRQATAFHTRRSIATTQMIWITTLNPARERAVNLGAPLITAMPVAEENGWWVT